MEIEIYCDESRQDLFCNKDQIADTNNKYSFYEELTNLFFSYNNEVRFRCSTLASIS